jgi:HD-GYP domain-containing protein (c-di-GMP phosphodiesterase class II)
VIRAEHERRGGKGYPDGLSGEEIPLASRIAFSCDAFHAMTSDRPYRKAMGVPAALAELESNAGTQSCPRVVRALLEVVVGAP